MERERIAQYARLAGLELGNDTNVSIIGDDPAPPPDDVTARADRPIDVLGGAS